MLPSIRAVLTPAPTGPSLALRAYRDFYRDPASRLALLVTALMMCYIGGLAMFWFHSVYLDEGGPAIGWTVHWLLDSSFAFVALTPALALIMPFAVWLARAVAPASKRWIPWLYATVAGTAFAMVTTPGPIAHDMLVGRGTWVAERVTQALGDPSAPLAPAADYPPLAAMAQQLGAGVPLYVALMAATVVVLRAILRPAPAREAVGAAEG
ncbi:hypothetical protein [Phytohabitans houttuyneae]|uniref:Uncharacterized protein n=1 Tax=Phytohabitans houttuyneae TaxID=1076126 RepID=A0A6V8KSW1_9ACTN|nr:hypothetical protein [Phytohabitans houttuyneae]GFJ85738.1 hypothetical protein Phou_099180 [Phytohabitans houttuyneae]